MRYKLKTYWLLLLIGSLILLISACNSASPETALTEPTTTDTQAVSSAIFWRGGSAAALDTKTGWSNALSVQVPANVEQGDFVLATVVTSAATTVTAPNGWRKIEELTDSGQVAGQGVRTTLFGRAWGSNKPRPIKFSFSRKTRGVATLQAYANVDANNPIDTIAKAKEGSSKQRHLLPRINTSVPGTVLVGIAGILSPKGSASATSNLSTERVDRFTGDAETDGVGLAFYNSSPRTNAGNESSRYVDSSAKTDTAAMLFLALKPEQSGGGNPDLWIPTQGAWLGGWGNYGERGLTGKVEGHEKRIGRKLDIIRNYHPVNNLPLGSDEIDYIKDGRKVFLNWKPSDNWKKAGAGEDTQLNKDLKTVADRLKSVAPAKVMITLYHEPEDNVSANSGRSAKDYAAMWRYVHKEWDKMGVDNVIYVWNMMGYLSSERRELYDSHELWPGDEYVDWVMWDPYSLSENPAPLKAKLTEFYSWLSENSAPGHNYASKPWGLAEWGISHKGKEGGAFEQQYYRDMKKELPNFSRLKMIAVFDTTTYKDDGTIRNNIRIKNGNSDSDPELQSYRMLAASPYLNQPDLGNGGN